MKKIRITYIKLNKIQSQAQITQLMEVTITTSKQEFNIPIYPGWSVLTVCEILPEITDVEIKPGNY